MCAIISSWFGSLILRGKQARIKNVGVGDHIQAINGTDLTGCRHFEVARMLKEIPIGSEFSMTLVEPRRAFGEFVLQRVCISVASGFPFVLSG